MGTRSLTHIIDKGKTLVTIYRQYDGYPSGMGADIRDTVGQHRITNGISGDSRNTSNGMGCLSAQLIAALKDRVGNVYIYPPDSNDCWEDYVYWISNIDGLPHLVCRESNGTLVYDGLLKNFNP